MWALRRGRLSDKVGGWEKRQGRRRWVVSSEMISPNCCPGCAVMVKLKKASMILWVFEVFESVYQTQWVLYASLDVQW